MRMVTFHASNHIISIHIHTFHKSTKCIATDSPALHCLASVRGHLGHCTLPAFQVAWPLQQNVSSTYLNQFISKVELLMLPDLIWFALFRKGPTTQVCHLGLHFLPLFEIICRRVLSAEIRKVSDPKISCFGPWAPSSAFKPNKISRRKQKLPAMLGDASCHATGHMGLLWMYHRQHLDTLPPSLSAAREGSI